MALMTRISPIAIRARAAKVAFTGAILLSAPAHAQLAESTARELSELSLEQLASIRLTSATRSDKPADRIAGTVRVISGEELSRQMLISDDLSAALSQLVPGYSPSTQKSNQFGESLRGRSALLLFDGVPQSNPLRVGTREGYFVDPAVVERIEVVSGASAIQGLGATGGIINIISKGASSPGSRAAIETRATSQFRGDSLGWKAGYSIAHKGERFDAFAYAGHTDRGIASDGHGRLIGMDAQRGDTMDSRASDYFVKIGTDFGLQRVQVSHNRYRLEPHQRYRAVDGDRRLGVPTTSAPGAPAGLPQTNRVDTTSLEYRHREWLRGLLTLQLFRQEFSSMFGASIGRSTFQDPAIAPPGTLIDQSQILADKLGARLTWVRKGWGHPGLEVTVGADWLRDEAVQRLALTGRSWVPPLEYTSISPFAQLEWDGGPYTIRAGLRHESARLKADDFRTLAFYGAPAVRGGEPSFDELLPSVGGVWRFAPRWSAYLSYNRGFGISDVGLVLREVRAPGQSVDMIADLQPVVTRSKELGLRWSAARANLTFAYFSSRSALGTNIVVDTVARIGRVLRVPIEVDGLEITGALELLDGWVLDGSYARLRGERGSAPDRPLDLEQNARSQGPDKLQLALNGSWGESTSARLQWMKLYPRHINVGRFIGGASQEEHFSGYSQLDFAMRYRWRRASIGLGIENLLDKRYFTYFSEADAGSQGANDTLFAGRGRTFTLSYRLTF